MTRLALALLVSAIMVASPPSYATDGDLDPTFGSGGTVSHPNFRGFSVLSVGDDALLIGGGGTGFALARLDADGALDPTFGSGGIVTTNDDEVAILDLVAQPDGKILAIGEAEHASGFGRQFRVLRYHPDGTLDLAYGTGGKATGTFATSVIANSGALQPDGALLVAGFVVNSAGVTYDMALARFAADGALDPTFGTAGETVVDFPDLGMAATDVVLAGDGGFFVVGYAARPLASGYDTDYIVVRHHADGTIDASFGDEGRVLTSFQSEYPYELPSAALLDPDGKLVVAGTSGPYFGVARYHPDGTLDATFGSGGLVHLHHFPVVDEAIVARQPDGKLLLAGTGYPVPEGVFEPTVFAVTRLQPDGRVDASFAPCPQVSTHVGADARVTDLLVRADGTFVVLGRRDPASGFAVARYGTPSMPSCQSAEPGRSALKIRNAADPGRALLKWRWKGEPVAVADFGDPTGATGYTFCVLDQGTGTPRSRVGSPMMRFGWSARSNGWAFKTKADNDFPFRAAKLVASPAGKGKVKILAKGEYLYPYLPLAAPVVARMVRDNGSACWEATFSAAVQSTAEQFSATSD